MIEQGLEGVRLQCLPGGLHRHPEKLRRELQTAIDAASAEKTVKRIAIGYGVCGRGTVGLHARSVPLSIPRVHDCIALFLGSDEAYREQFKRFPGTYYIAAGWVEEQTEPLPQTDKGDVRRTDEHRDVLEEQYGEENGRAIHDFLTSWQRNYQRAAFIDTGAGADKRKYDELARRMAERHGWVYEKLPGSRQLLYALLAADVSDDDRILRVPPGYVTAYDPMARGLTCRPEMKGAEAGDAGVRRSRVRLDGDGEPVDSSGASRTGLGIDAGGTYTDAVVYDFASGALLDKAKALTTPWRYTVGISEALGALEPKRIENVSLVALSTTLATNAIVEGRGQKVGLLLMPPYGKMRAERFKHAPIAMIEGQLEIDGRELEPVNPQQVRQVTRELLAQDVRAFAVAGYAGHANPAHELQVKAVIREMCSLPVTCGHDISEGLNYRLRAETAALNARIIPCLEALIEDVRATLAERGIEAPLMVVRSDGSLMSVETALDRPVETLLSGPAASAAGAFRLARRDHAIVVDIGGTTTDTAVIADGRVMTCEEGAVVGGWETHVRSLKMRTMGLGGDSRIAVGDGDVRIGPRRVAPLSWLAAARGFSAEAMRWIEEQGLGEDGDGEIALDVLALNPGETAPDGLSDDERRILDVLAAGPISLRELAVRMGRVTWRLLPIAGLEDRHLVQRGGLTPTDVLHAAGHWSFWDADCARRACAALAAEARMTVGDLHDRVIDGFVQRLAIELVTTQLADRVDPDDLASSAAAMTLLRAALEHDVPELSVGLTLHHPVIGIGAPAAFFLPRAAEQLNAEAVVPENADVANAIGAVTSGVRVSRAVTVAPDDGDYRLEGVPDAPVFKNLEEAEAYAVQHLTAVVSAAARRAGALSRNVEIAAEDRIADAAGGQSLFIGRTITATINAAVTGQPSAAG